MTLETTKVMVFGSCMSNLTASHLVSDYGFEQTHSVHHNRSDSFIKYFIDNNDEMIPLEYLESHLIYKPEMEQEARQFLRNQYREHIGFHNMPNKKRADKTFFDDLREMQFDIILLDNFMDVAAKLVYWKENIPYIDKALFLNIGFYSNEDVLAHQFWHTEYLDPEISAKNWIKIYNWIRKYQPHAKIYFIPYHYCSSGTVPERYDRIKSFYDFFSDAAAHCEMTIFPPLNVAQSLTKGEEDWPHFQPPMYRAIAGSIYLDYQTSFFSRSTNQIHGTQPQTEARVDRNPLERDTDSSTTPSHNHEVHQQVAE